MQYRMMKPSEYDEVVKLCKRNDVVPPLQTSMILIAVTEDNKIVSVAAARQITIVESFVSENAIASVKLFKTFIDVLITIFGKKSVFCLCNPEREKLFNDTGFITLAKNKTFMEKEF
jgi:citrate lyase synthetase